MVAEAAFQVAGLTGNALQTILYGPLCHLPPTYPVLLTWKEYRSTSRRDGSVVRAEASWQRGPGP